MLQGLSPSLVCVGAQRHRALPSIVTVRVRVQAYTTLQAQQQLNPASLRSIATRQAQNFGLLAQVLVASCFPFCA